MKFWCIEPLQVFVAMSGVKQKVHAHKERRSEAILSNEEGISSPNEVMTMDSDTSGNNGISTGSSSSMGSTGAGILATMSTAITDAAGSLYNLAYPHGYPGDDPAVVEETEQLYADMSESAAKEERAIQKALENEKGHEIAAISDMSISRKTRDKYIGHCDNWLRLVDKKVCFWRKHFVSAEHDIMDANASSSLLNQRQESRDVA